MSGYEIKEATMDQLDNAAKLLDNYRVFYKQESDFEATREFINKRLQNRDSIIFIAYDKEKDIPVGIAQLYPSFSTVSLKRQWILNDLFVERSYRKKGVGNELLRSIEIHFRDKAKGLILVTAKDNDPAKRLYERNDWETGLYDFYYKVF